MAQVDFKHLMQPRLALSSPSSCLCLSCAFQVLASWATTLSSHLQVSVSFINTGFETASVVPANWNCWDYIILLHQPPEHLGLCVVPIVPTVGLLLQVDLLELFFFFMLLRIKHSRHFIFPTLQPICCNWLYKCFVCLYACMYQMHAWYPQRPEHIIGSPGT